MHKACWWRQVILCPLKHGLYSQHKRVSACQKETSPFEIFRRQLTIAGSHSLNHDNIIEALATIQNCIPELEKIVTHKLNAEDIATYMQDGVPKDSLKIQADNPLSIGPFV